MHFKISNVFKQKEKDKEIEKESLVYKDEVPDSKKSNSMEGASGGGNSSIVIKLDRCKTICGDIKIEFYSKNMMRNRKKLFSFWFNTYFVSEKSGAGEHYELLIYYYYLFYAS